VDWLSVSIGNVHGAISAATRGEKKITARLNIERLRALQTATQVPMVLHGGSGIDNQCILDGIAAGIAKINIATTIRQAYEPLMDESTEKAQEAVYASTCEILRNELQVAGKAGQLLQ
jgi:fructose-bisphosphate aldolase class II